MVLVGKANVAGDDENVDGLRLLIDVTPQYANYLCRVLAELQDLRRRYPTAEAVTVKCPPLEVAMLRGWTRGLGPWTSDPTMAPLPAFLDAIGRDYVPSTGRAEVSDSGVLFWATLDVSGTRVEASKYFAWSAVLVLAEGRDPFT